MLKKTMCDHQSKRSLFRVRRPKIQAFVCLVLGEWFMNTVFSSFHLHPGHKDNMEEKTYPAIDLPVYGEADGINFILIED